QKPKFAAGRSVCVRGDDLEVCVDELRFITVFMNLIGNALKYSDGEVRITWRTCEDKVLIAVQDQGRDAQGISREQAQRLFVPFGRLEAHAKIEGTGLGLLSVKTIAQAHEGEVYIEGASDSESFSTASASYPPMLEEGFCTAFVTACPLPILSQPPLEEQELQCETAPDGSQLPIFQEAVAAPNDRVIAGARK
ncbi:MAG TPA: ATP-binding protein, partial [Abditibacterium sp.]